MKEELANDQESILNFSLKTKQNPRSSVWVSGDNFGDSEMKPSHPPLHTPLLSGPGLRFISLPGDAPRAQWEGKLTRGCPFSDAPIHRSCVTTTNQPAARSFPGLRDNTADLHFAQPPLLPSLTNRADTQLENSTHFFSVN